MKHPISERFHQILKELGDLHDAKSEDYGTGEDPLANVRASERFGIPAWVGSVLRAGDKIARLQTYIKKGSLKHESAEDSLRDAAVYFVIALVLFEEQTRKPGNDPGSP